MGKRSVVFKTIDYMLIPDQTKPMGVELGLYLPSQNFISLKLRVNYYAIILQ